MSLLGIQYPNMPDKCRVCDGDITVTYADDGDGHSHIEDVTCEHGCTNEDIPRTRISGRVTLEIPDDIREDVSGKAGTNHLIWSSLHTAIKRMYPDIDVELDLQEIVKLPRETK